MGKRGRSEGDVRGIGGRGKRVGKGEEVHDIPGD